MATSFRDLKKSREAMFEALNKQVEDQGKKGGGRPEADPRFWYPAVDAAGNTSARIRFLPAPSGETVPYIMEYAHGFRGPTGQWYIQKSRTTIKGEKDPVGEYNRAQWALSKEAEAQGDKAQMKRLQDACKTRKRNTSYVANIQVISDGQNPENNGKTFLYRYGLKIHGMIEEAMKPTFEGEKPMNPFDPWEGADLLLKITTNAPTAGQKKGFRNYDKSKFAEPSPLGSDAEIEAIWKQEHPLQPIIAEDQFESYENLEKMFNRVMGFKADGSTEAPARQPTRTAEPKQVSKTIDTPDPADDADDDDDDDADLKRFRELAGIVDDDDVPF